MALTNEVMFFEDRFAGFWFWLCSISDPKATSSPREYIRMGKEDSSM